MKQLLSLLRSLGAALFLWGCANGGDDARDPKIELKQIAISLDQEANENSATAVELLVLYKLELLKALMKMTSAEYFAAAAQLKRDYPDMIEVFRWELTPGQNIGTQDISRKNDEPVGAVVFADYQTPGTHRIRIGGSSKITLRLKAQDFCIVEQGCGAEPEELRKPLEDRIIESIRAGLGEKPAPKTPAEVLKKELATESPKK